MSTHAKEQVDKRRREGRAHREQPVVGRERSSAETLEADDGQVAKQRAIGEPKDCCRQRETSETLDALGLACEDLRDGEAARCRDEPPDAGEADSFRRVVGEGVCEEADEETTRAIEDGEEGDEVRLRSRHRLWVLVRGCQRKDDCSEVVDVCGWRPREHRRSRGGERLNSHIKPTPEHKARYANNRQKSRSCNKSHPETFRSPALCRIGLASSCRSGLVLRNRLLSGLDGSASFATSDRSEMSDSSAKSRLGGMSRSSDVLTAK